MRYAIWNNKGGVGKTFISFVLSTEYANAHKDKIVVVVDMCPQANLSEIILGGNGEGATKLENILAGAEKRLTIGGYFHQRILSPHFSTGSESSYFLHAKDYNSSLPDNLYLICGDPSLERQAEAINQISGQTLPEESWKNVHSWLLDLLTKDKKYENAVAFIDCNPSFSAYTELSMIASEKLIIPCTSDGSSARAIDNIFALLYGKGQSEQYTTINFHSRAKTFNLILPKIHCVLLNRSTQYDKKASKAFGAMFGEIKKRITHRQEDKDAQENFSQEFIKNLSNGEGYDDIPDSHSVAIVCSHEGLPLFETRPGLHKIHKENPQVNSAPLSRYRDSISQVIQKL